MKKLSIIIAMVISVTIHAQLQSPLERFEVDYEGGCSPFTVHITPLPSVSSLPGVQYSYEEGVTETSDTTYTYTTIGQHRIIQYLGEDAYPQTDTIFFEVNLAETPEYDVYVCSATEFIINLTDEYYDYYIIKFDSEDSVIATPQSRTYHSFSSGSGTISVKGYFENAAPNCGIRNMSLNLAEPEPTEVDTMYVAAGCLNSYYLEVNGQEFNSSYLYELEYSTDNTSFTQVYLGPITINNNSYPIPELTNLSEEICIHLNTLNACDSSVMFTTTSCGTFSNASSLKDAYASYSGSNIIIYSGTTDTEHELYQSTGNNFTFYQEFEESITDEPLSNFRATNYKITTVDSCGTAYDSAFVSPPYLSLITRNYDDNQITISAEAPINELTLISDSILVYDSDSSTVLTLPNTSQVTLPSNIGELVSMRLQYTYEENIKIYSNEVSVEVVVEVYIPNAFTPNNDGLNDELVLFGLPTENFTFQVFDRWGKIIHQTNTNPVWGGKIGNKKVNEGNYLYRLTFELESGEVKTQVGTFAVIDN